MQGICGLMFRNYGSVTDTSGCCLPEGHDGDHEFKCTSGRTILWHTDMDCDCEDCLSDDSNNWCSVYHEKKLILPSDGATDKAVALWKEAYPDASESPSVDDICYFLLGKIDETKNDRSESARSWRDSFDRMHHRAMNAERNFSLIKLERNECESMLRRWIPFGNSMGNIARLIIEDTNTLLSSIEKSKSVEVIPPVDSNVVTNSDSVN